MERESSLDERLRQDKEKAEANEARRLRTGGVDVLVEEAASAPAPKAPAKTTAKASTKKRRTRAKSSAK